MFQSDFKKKLRMSTDIRIFAFVPNIRIRFLNSNIRIFFLSLRFLVIFFTFSGFFSSKFSNAKL